MSDRTQIRSELLEAAEKAIPFSGFACALHDSIEESSVASSWTNIYMIDKWKPLIEVAMRKLREQDLYTQSVLHSVMHKVMRYRSQLNHIILVIDSDSEDDFEEVL